MVLFLWRILTNMVIFYSLKTSVRFKYYYTQLMDKAVRHRDYMPETTGLTHAFQDPYLDFPFAQSKMLPVA